MHVRLPEREGAYLTPRLTLERADVAIDASR
jgi:hypothetical protein